MIFLVDSEDRCIGNFRILLESYSAYIKRESIMA